MTVTGQDDLIPGFGPPDQFRQLTLGVSHRDLHATLIMVQTTVHSYSPDLDHVTVYFKG